MKVLFIDMDNTIAENATCDNVKFTDGLYLSKRPIQIVIDAIFALYPDAIKVILSRAQGGDNGILEKQQWLSENFGPVNDCIFLDETEGYYMKGVYADRWLTMHDIDSSDALVIDDSKQVLRYCKAYGMNVKYPQQLICDYEQLKMEKHSYKDIRRN